MKITYISSSIIPSRTANSIHVMKMCQAFSENGHEVILLAPEYKNKYEKNIKNIFEFYSVKNNFKIIKLPACDFNYKGIVYLFNIFKYLLFNKTDLVYGRYLYGYFLSLLLGFKSIYEAHKPIRSRKFKFIFNKLINKDLIVISQALKNIYLQNGYLNDDKIHVAHDGADKVNDFTFKTTLKGKKNNLKFGYVGHLYKGKGIEVIEKIADKVSDNIEFHIIGGLEEDIMYWKDKIISSNVYFYGFIKQTDISKYINSLDVCLLPNQKIVLPHGTTDEKKNISAFTSPLKMFEYMAHKKPIISSNIMVLQEVLNSDIAILVDPENSTEWLDAIEEMKNENLRKKLSLNALKEFHQYTWKARAAHIIKNCI